MLSLGRGEADALGLELDDPEADGDPEEEPVSDTIEEGVTVRDGVGVKDLIGVVVLLVEEVRVIVVDDDLERVGEFVAEDEKVGNRREGEELAEFEGE